MEIRNEEQVESVYDFFRQKRQRAFGLTMLIRIDRTWAVEAIELVSRTSRRGCFVEYVCNKNKIDTKRKTEKQLIDIRSRGREFDSLEESWQFNIMRQLFIAGRANPLRKGFLL